METFKFEELPKEAQQKLIDKHRDWYTCDSWWSDEHLVDFVEVAKEAGFILTTDQIHWCLETRNGVMFSADVCLETHSEGVLRYCEYDARIVISRRIMRGYSSCGSRYMDCETEISDEIADLFLSEAVALADALWQRMVDDYEYLTSDEAIAESLAENFYDRRFYKNGDEAKVQQLQQKELSLA